MVEGLYEVEEVLNDEYTLVVGHEKKRYEDELEDCKVRLELCKEAEDKAKCIKENFEAEVLADLDARCEEMLSAYPYFGLKKGDEIIYPIPVPKELKGKASVMEALAKGKVSVDELTCEQLKGAVSELVKLVQEQQALMDVYRSQLTSLKKVLKSAMDELGECEEQLIEMRKACKDPKSKILEMAGVSVQQLIEKIAEVKKAEAEALALQKEKEVELEKVKNAKELLEKESGPSIERQLELLETLLNEHLPKFIELASKLKGKE